MGGSGRMSVAGGSWCPGESGRGAGLLLRRRTGTGCQSDHHRWRGSGTEAAKIALGMRAIVASRHRPEPTGLPLRHLRRASRPRHPNVADRRPTSQTPTWSWGCPGSGAKAPKLVVARDRRQHAARQRRGRHRHRPGRLLETSRTTTIRATYVEEGVVHYCVANILGAVARYLHARSDLRDAALLGDSGRPRSACQPRPSTSPGQEACRT